MTLSAPTLDFIRQHAEDDVRALALQAGKYPDVDIRTAIVQISGRQAAKDKVPSWAATEGLLYPPHLSLEQCSSELTARYKALQIAEPGESLVDLTGGFGIDCAFLASRFRQAVYVERQEALCEIAAHNFPLLDLNHITVCNEDAIAYLQQMEPVDTLFIDPARRNEHGGKTVSIADCEPDVAQWEELLVGKARRVIIKLSPMLDLTLALNELRHVCEVHIVSVNNECKELLLFLKREPAAEIPIHCINLTSKSYAELASKSAHSSKDILLSESDYASESVSPKGIQNVVFTREQEQSAPCPYTSETGVYLYEPNASLLKAGAFRTIAYIYKVKKLHPNSHLYTSDEYIENFPGRVFRIRAVGSFNKKETKELLGDIRKANLTVRNFPASVAELRKRLKLAEGGDTYLFATTLSDDRKVLIRSEKM